MLLPNTITKGTHKADLRSGYALKADGTEGEIPVRKAEHGNIVGAASGVSAPKAIVTDPFLLIATLYKVLKFVLLQGV
jgi:hypothetical protein